MGSAIDIMMMRPSGFLGWLVVCLSATMLACVIAQVPDYWGEDATPSPAMAETQESVSATGCCFSIGYGAMMKPCCLTTKKGVLRSKCPPHGRVGGAQGFTLGACPTSADAAKLLIDQPRG